MTDAYTSSPFVTAIEPITAPLGSTKGSFIDASMVYGSAD